MWCPRWYCAQARKPPPPPGWSNCLFEQGNTATCKSVIFQKPSMLRATLQVFHVHVQKIRNISRIFLSKKFKLKYVIKALITVSLQLKQKNKTKTKTKQTPNNKRKSNVVVGDHCILELQRCTTHSVPEQTVSWESPERCQVLVQVMDIQSERMGTPSGASLEGGQVSRRVLGRGISVCYVSVHRRGRRSCQQGQRQSGRTWPTTGCTCDCHKW